MIMIKVSTFLSGIIFALFTAHANEAKLRYLGNEGVMVSEGNSKILFDPFFHNHYNTYTLVPDNIRQSLFAGSPPYHDIDILFISHAHEDHFNAQDVLSFLQKHKNSRLIAPQDAAGQVLFLNTSDELKTRITSIKLNYGDPPIQFKSGSITVEAVRIPHAGWPKRASVANIVYRVTMSDGISLIHMGDADVDDTHFSRNDRFWKQSMSDLALPPYWFMLSQQGLDILDQRINAKRSIGIHVDAKVPDALISSKRDYLSTPGEIRSISIGQDLDKSRSEKETN